MQRQKVEKQAILIGLVGSHAYGLATNSSDRDYRGIFIAPKEYHLGLWEIEQKDSDWNEPGELSFLDGAEDCVIYELKKFFKLLLNNNPNILELLWLKDYELLTPAGEKLIQHRERFLSTKIIQSYAGYAYAQIARVERHRRWLLNPPTHRPEIAEYGLTEKELVNKEIANTFYEYLYLVVRDQIEFLEPASELRELLLERIDYKHLFKSRGLGTDFTREYAQFLTRASDEFVSLLHKSHEFRRDRASWDNYQRWLKNRNPDRAALEAKVGYDTKHLTQCLRLLRQALEVLDTGKIVVDRQEAGDADYLLSVKQGKVSYEEVKKEADELFELLKQAPNRASLPKYPDQNLAQNLCVELIEASLF
jgi:uncharacterized protein